MPLLRRASIIALALSLGVAASARADAREANFADAAVDAVVSLSDEVLRTTHAPDLSTQERWATLRALFRSRFNIPAMAQQSLGYHWATATWEQRREFTALFETMIVGTYAARLSAYTAGEFRVTGKRDEGPNDALVYTQVAGFGRPGFERIDWRVRISADAQPRIIDVIVTGVSQVMSAQDAFAASIQADGGGLAGLIERLRLEFPQPVYALE